MAIENAIAQFGMNAGNQIQNTVGNALARAENRSRYNDQNNMLLAQQEQEARAAAEKAEIDYTLNGVTSWDRNGRDPRIMQGWVKGAVERGYLSPQEAAAWNEEKMIAAMGEVRYSPKTGSDDMPYDVRSYNFYKDLPEDQRADFLNVKRAGQPLNLNDRIIYRQPSGDEQVYTKGVSPDQDPQLKAAQERATLGVESEIRPTIERDIASSKAQGKIQGEAAAGMPQAEFEANQMLSLLAKAKSHPGLEAAVGKSSVGNLMAVPGSSRANFLVLLDQLQGKAFLQAFESLKGAGQITEVEGRKATEAIARLSTSQSESEFIAALEELENIVRTGLERKKQQAGKAEIDALVNKYAD